MSRLLPSLLFVALFTILQLCFVCAYLDHEHTVHFWDYAMYANMAASQFLTGGWDSFAQSFAQKYNLLFSLPSLFSFALFGASRFVFILTNFIVYFLCYQLAVSALLRCIFDFDWLKALLWAMGACSLVPFLWYPLLQGYPDHGAAAALIVALALGCRPRQSLKQALALGLLIGLAIVFRRHYTYAGLALLFAGVLLDLPGWKTKGFWLQHFTRGAAALAVLAALEPSYLMEMATTDYRALYQSYERSPLYILLFIASHAGIVLMVSAALGWGVVWKNRGSAHPSLELVLLSALGWVALWAFGPAQAGQHYLIALLPPVFVIGIVALFTTKEPVSPLISSALLIALVANSAFCLWFAPHFVLPSDHPVVSFFGSPRPPWVRKDRGELESLARYVSQTTTDKDRIAVSGSSFIFNQDLVRALYTDVLRDISPAYRFIPAPESDGDQAPPLHVYAAANVYLIASPTQYHLDPARQKNVTAFAAQFPPPQEIKALFSKDDKTFLLERGVTVSIWRRKPWTPAALNKALESVRRLSENYSVPWVFTTGGTQSSFQYDARAKVFNLAVLLSPLEPSAHLFFDAPLKKQTSSVRATATKQGACPDIQLKSILQTPGGQTLFEKEIRISAPPQAVDFPLIIKASQGAFWSLVIEKPTSFPCLLSLQALRVEEAH